jgi:hypothetical protein
VGQPPFLAVRVEAQPVPGVGVRGVGHRRGAGRGDAATAAAPSRHLGGVNLTTCYLFFMPHATCTMYTHTGLSYRYSLRILTEREASLPAHSVV